MCALCFNEDVSVQVLDCTADFDLSPVALMETGLDDDELVRTGGGAVVQVQVGRHADFVWEVQ